MGKLADVYVTLPGELTANYKELKDALLKSFHWTSDHYRNIFWSAKISVAETYQQFSMHLGRL